MRIVFCSVPLAEADFLAKGILMEHLAACVQVVPTVKSFYWWNEELCEDHESILICKTDVSMVASLTSYIKDHHSYEVPEVVSVPIQEQEGNEEYLSWMLQELRSAG